MKKSYLFLLITSFVFFLLRLPSLFEPYWYGDEGIYETIGIAIRNGRLLYKDIWDNKPPLLYALYAASSGDQFTVRMLSLIVGVGCVIAFFLLSRNFFSSRISYILAALFVFLFGTPLLEGNIANSENFMMLPTLLAALFVVWSTKSRRKIIQLAIAGFLLSLSFLLKTVAVFDFVAFFLFLLFTGYKEIKAVPALLLRMAPFVTSFAVPIAATALFFLAKGAFLDFIHAAFLQNVGYVSYGNAFLIPQGLLVLKLIILFVFCALLFTKRKQMKPSFLFILLWLGFSVFNAFFSQRPYTHYTLVLLPSFLLFFGTLLPSQKHALLPKLKIASFILLFFLIAKNFHFYTKILPYYRNYISFITLPQSIDSYRAFFDQNTPNDYKLAQFISSHSASSDGLFVWGNNAQLYALTSKLPPGRFTVLYHITAHNEYMLETKNAFLKAQPRYVILSSQKNPFPYSLALYKERLKLKDSLIYERVF